MIIKIESSIDSQESAAEKAMIKYKESDCGNKTSSPIIKLIGIYYMDYCQSNSTHKSIIYMFEGLNKFPD